MNSFPPQNKNYPIEFLALFGLVIPAIILFLFIQNFNIYFIVPFMIIILLILPFQIGSLIKLYQQIKPQGPWRFLVILESIISKIKQSKKGILKVFGTAIIVGIIIALFVVGFTVPKGPIMIGGLVGGIFILPFLLSSEYTLDTRIGILLVMGGLATLMYYSTKWQTPISEPFNDNGPRERTQSMIDTLISTGSMLGESQSKFDTIQTNTCELLKQIQNILEQNAVASAPDSELSLSEEERNKRQEKRRTITRNNFENRKKTNKSPLIQCFTNIADNLVEYPNESSKPADAADLEPALTNATDDLESLINGFPSIDKIINTLKFTRPYVTSLKKNAAFAATDAVLEDLDAPPLGISPNVWMRATDALSRANKIIKSIDELEQSPLYVEQMEFAQNMKKKENLAKTGDIAAIANKPAFAGLL